MSNFSKGAWDSQGGAVILIRIFSKIISDFFLNSDSIFPEIPKITPKISQQISQVLFSKLLNNLFKLLKLFQIFLTFEVLSHFLRN